MTTRRYTLLATAFLAVIPLGAVTRSNAETPAPTAAAATLPVSLSSLDPATFASTLVPAARALSSSDKPEIAKEVLNQLQGMQPNRGTESDRLLLQGIAQYRLKDLPAAIGSLRSSLELRDSNPKAQYYLSRSLKDAGRCGEALKQLEELRFRLPGKHPDYYQLRGECLLAQGKEAEAKTALDEGSKLAGADPALKQLLLSLRQGELGTGSLDIGTAAQMDADLGALAKANPNDKKLQLLYAQQLVRKGDIVLDPVDLDEAEKIVSALAEQSNYSNETATKLLIMVLLKRRAYDRADQVIQRAIRALPGSEVYADAAKQLEIERSGWDFLRFQKE